MFLAAAEKVKCVEHPDRAGWAALLCFCMCVVKTPRGRKEVPGFI